MAKKKKEEILEVPEPVTAPLVEDKPKKPAKKAGKKASEEIAAPAVSEEVKIEKTEAKKTKKAKDEAAPKSAAKAKKAVKKAEPEEVVSETAAPAPEPEKSDAEVKEVKPKKAKKVKETTKADEEVKAEVIEAEKPAEDIIEPKPAPVSVKNDPDPILPRYSDEELEEFRAKIMDFRHEAMDELRMLRERLDDYLTNDPEESMIYSMHMAEQGPEALEQEKTYAQVQRISEYIKKLDDALQRIKDKTYGVCRVCKCLIAKERLMAVPITTLSAAYKIHKKCPSDGIDRIEPVKK